MSFDDGNLGFEAASVPNEGGDREVLPAGVYTAMVESWKTKLTKARDGKYAEIVFVITDQPHKGRKIWARYNYENPNAQAQSIGRRQLGEISHACGNTEPLTNLNQILNKVCAIELTVRDAGQYGKQNDVKKAMPVGAAPTSPEPSGDAQAPASGAPWEQ